MTPSTKILLKERELKKILRMIGLNADAIETLEMNDIKDIKKSQIRLNIGEVRLRVGEDRQADLVGSPDPRQP